MEQTLPSTADPGLSMEQASTQLRERCLHSLFFWCKASLGMKDLTPRLHGRLCAHLQSRRKKRRGTKMARGHLKTSVGTIGNSMQRGFQWLCGNTYPEDAFEINYLIVSSTARNAELNFSKEFKTRFETSPTLRWLFPDVIMGPIWNNSLRQLDRIVDSHVVRRVSFHFIGVGGKVSSGHYRHIWLDDLHAVEEATESPPSVEDVVRWYRHTDQLLVEPDIDEIDVIGTHSSLKPPDVFYYIQANEKDKYEWLELGCYDDNGLPLWPERFSETYLASLRKKMGEGMFALTMLNNPIDESVTEIRLEWFPRYYTSGPLESQLYVCSDKRRIYQPQLFSTATLDLSGFKNPRGCSNALTVLGRTSDEYNIIMHVWKKRCDPSGVLAAIREAYELTRFSVLGIEEVGLQEVLAYYIERDLKDLPITVKPVTPHGVNKDLRTRALIPLMREGRFAISDRHIQLLDELARFPQGERDLLDTLAYQPQVWQIPFFHDDPEEFERECRQEYLRSLGVRGGEAYA
jgi:hypothetical protein